MTDQVAISGEYCTLLLETVAIAASRNFSLKVDSASFGNFVARGTSKWRKNFPADIGASMDIDGLIVVVDTSPAAKQFDDLFTYLDTGTQLTVVFTLKTNTPSEKTFIYTGEAFLTTLSVAAPQFGESTYSCSLIFTGAIVQTTGTVS